MHGQFRFFLPEGEIVIPNTVVDNGEEQFLKAIFQNVFPIAGGGNFYIGLCNQVPADLDVLGSITTEPNVLNGYARKAITRDATGWPTIDQVNSDKRITSAQVTFTAAGGSFDKSFTRAFLCDVSSGSTGNLFAYSGALSQAITLADTQSFAMQYEFFAD